MLHTYSMLYVTYISVVIEKLALKTNTKWKDKLPVVRAQETEWPFLPQSDQGGTLAQSLKQWGDSALADARRAAQPT